MPPQPRAAARALPAPAAPRPKTRRARPLPPSCPAAPKPKAARRSPRPELEALRLAVHHPEKIAGRLDIALFSSALAAGGLRRACFGHDAPRGHRVGGARSRRPARPAGRRGHQGGRRRRPAASSSRRQRPVPWRSCGERPAAARPSAATVELAGRSASLRHALEAMRSVEPGPDYVGALGWRGAALVSFVAGKS